MYENQPIRSPCDEVQLSLCRLALGDRTRARGLRLAEHVRRCAECDGFVDELSAVRQWLDVAKRPLALRRRRAELARLARLSLARELAARVSRDLLQASRGHPVRPAQARRRDMRRLQALRADGWLRCAMGLGSGEWTRVRDVLLDGCAQPGEALALAARLDPLGLDVGLAWMGQLVRVGSDHEAHRVAERLLADVQG